MQHQASSIGRPVPSFQPVSPTSHTLVGQYTILQPLDPSRHSCLFNLIRDLPSLWDYMFKGPFESEQAFKDHLVEKNADNSLVNYVIVDKESPLQPLGMFSFMRIFPTQKTLEIGSILFSPQLQKTRIATEALYLTAKYVFQELKYIRYEWKCNNLNEASKKAARRFGFKFEGVFRRHMIIKNHSRDTAWFSIIDEEWSQIKREYERWLEPSNFDERGLQKTKLSIEVEG